MKVLLEFLLFLGIFFPLYHIGNIIFMFKKRRRMFNKDSFISILIPCYNEEKIVRNTIDGLLRIDYEKYECIFINDGSIDGTFEEINNTLQLRKIDRIKNHNLDTKEIKGFYQSVLFPNIFVIDKENGGKSEALNAGINYSIYDCIVTLDADSILKKDALAIINGAFDDEDVVAASGVIQVMQSFNLSKDIDTTNLKVNNLLKLQTIEYIKSCFCYKASLAKLNSLLVISGAFGIFRKDILLEVNGFAHVIGEDLDLTLKIQFAIQNTNRKISYVPEAICYTEGPENFSDYVKQRKRWQQSFIESLFSFKNIIFKDALTKNLPFFMIIDALFLGIISSFIVVLSLIVIIRSILNNTVWYILIYLMIFISVHLIYDIFSLTLAWYYGIRYKGWDIIRVIFTIIMDVFIYRFTILYTVIVGTISYFTSKKDWNKVRRSGRDYFTLNKDGSL